ncbi:MAG: hypothetical protein FWB74_06565 [Defluviitaleaceae bacterium]|nr:hypothetical protein [Defluviitaleaceae bacterium]
MQIVMDNCIIDLESYGCPLLGRQICMSECYDIQSVRARFMRKDSTVASFDATKAASLCPRCPYNQMGGE